MKQEKTAYHVQSVEKALELLEILAELQDGATLQMLADTLQLSHNKTFRLLATLCRKELVEKEPGTGRYSLTVGSAVFAQRLMQSISLASHAHPIIEDLARQHDEAVYMAVIRDGDVLFLDMVDCEQQIRANPFVGKRVPFFTNAAGKVMKALDSTDLLERLLKRRGPKGAAPDLEKLEREFQEIRSKGVAVETGGLGEGICSVAVAVRDYAGKIIGAITLLGPAFRILSDRLEAEIIPSLLQGAEQLSARFGYAPLLS